MSNVEVALDHQFLDTILSAIETDYLRDVAKDHFVPAMTALATSKRNTGDLSYLSCLAWIQFSIGAIKLYVPDKAFDPQLQPMMEREFLEELQVGLESKISALKAFELLFTGQTTNEQIKSLQQELTAIGPIPDQVRPVFRPEASELHRLQAEFVNVLHAVNSPSVASALKLLKQNPTKAAEDLLLVKENVQRLIDRLSSRFEAYQDMTRPAINLMQCLLVGFSLCESISAAKVSSTTQQLIQMAPFLGDPTSKAVNEDISPNNFEFLSVIKAIVSIDGANSLDGKTRELIFECFHKFNDDWNQRLKADREAEEARTSLYKFRGAAEDEEEFDAQEFEELFPTYDNEDPAQQPVKKSDQVRIASLRVAQAHKEIFFDKADPTESLKSTCVDLNNRITDELQDRSNVDHTVNGQMLAGAVLLLDEKLSEIQSTSVDKSYNFYTSSNLAEARQLVTLIHRLRTRFRELQRVDEIAHMQPLADVLQFCEKMLDLVHTEPLAKILTKVEQLHVYVYEWQFGGGPAKYTPYYHFTML